MKINFNEVNNKLSDTLLENGRLEELFSELGWEFKWESNGYRGKCFHPESDGQNLKVRTDGDVLPIWFTCFSNNCQEDFKPSLLGLVRGFLSVGRDKPCPIKEAIAFIRRFTDVSVL
jgi:hypothetical protein